MRTIEAKEAQTRFGALLNEVENGETVIVTRDGHRAGIAAAVEEWPRYRREHHRTLAGLSIREFIEARRR